MGSQRVGHDWATKQQQPLKQLMCPGNCIRNEQEERGVGRSQCKKRKRQGSSLYYHQVVWQGWNSTYASSRNHEEIRVWALKLVTHLKGLAIHRGNTPASSCGGGKWGGLTRYKVKEYLIWRQNGKENTPKITYKWATRQSQHLDACFTVWMNN